MEKTNSSWKSALKYFLLYVLIATLGTPLLIYLLAFVTENYVSGHETSLDAIMNDGFIDEITLVVSNLLIILLFVQKGYTRLNLSEKPWTTVAQHKQVFTWAVLLELASILPLNVLVASLQLSDYETVLAADDHLGVLGIVGVCLFVPLAEELVMRGGIEEKLLQWKDNAVVAIGGSAFLFAILHVYPSLMINAFIAGLITGWVYYRTRNVLVCVAMHLACNTLSCIMDVVQPESTSSDFLQETQIVFLSLISLAFMVFFITKLKKVTSPK